MDADDKNHLVLKAFLDMIPENIPDMVYSKEYDCFKELNDASYKSQLNGDFSYSKLFDNKSAFPTGGVEKVPVPDLCEKMEVDCLSDADRSEISDGKFSSNTSSPGSDHFRLPAELRPPGEISFVKIYPPSELKVKCLQSMESLKEVCKNERLNFNDCSAYYEEMKSDSEDNSDTDDVAYEVDLIIEDRVVEGEKQYLVKWKNYPMDSNTWEPVYNLTGCRQMIHFYRTLKKDQLRVDALEYFVRDLTTRKPYDILSLTKVCALCSNSTEDYVNSLKLTIPQLKAKARELLDFNRGRLSKIKDRLLEIMQFAEARKPVLIDLKEWETKINSTNESTFIQVENNVDLEKSPYNFTFIHDYVSKIVETPEEPVTFCQCEDCYGNRKSCCPHDSEGMFAYSRYRRLMLEPGYPIYECNKRCKCGSDCINRVVQHGQKVKVSIFRTANGCGWGLKTLETIEKGQFVLEYLGEIITSEAAEARGHIYDYVRRSYLFDLDYGVDNCCYTVDAGHMGNAAHFINHSCDPNLHVFAVWINQPNPNLPRLAFFARRKIRRGEELTFDYKMVQKDRFGSQSSTSDNDRVRCRCNSKNCRKYLF